MGYIRTAVWGFIALMTIIAGMFLMPFFWLIRIFGGNPQPHARRYASWWGRAMLWATGSKVTISGQQQLPPGAVVVMGNHQSIFDIMLLLGHFEKELAFIAKIETESYPIISNWMKYIDCLFIDRSDLRQSSRILGQAVSQLKDGVASLVIFPEGTRSKTGEMLEFKKGSMKLPQRAQVPIIPVAIDGTLGAYEGNGRKMAPSDVRMHICPPIMPEEFVQQDTGAISLMVEDSVRRGLEFIRNNG